ncbi:UNVERIFIED_CONTAM: hypothetical protein Sradi_0872700 [Sesamum radiatum]|uniref:Uncharacterized protein n=1 Tax=Sesamum radiatum TaxID=300843 RepID=A0AAW2V1Q9_SESRA
MIQHLDVMKDMIRELQNAGCELSDEQQVLAVLRSLPEQTWGHVNLVLTHNEKIKMFDSVASHLKLEAEHRESERAQQGAFIAHAGQRKPHKGKRWNKPTGVGPSNSQSQKQNLAPQGDKAMKRRRGKRGGKKNMANANAITVKRWVTLLVNALSQRRYRRNKTCDKGLSRIHKLPSTASMQSLHCYGEWRTRGGPWDWFIPTQAQHWV